MQIGLARSLSFWRAWVAFSALALTLLLSTSAQAGTATSLEGWGYGYSGQFDFPSDVTQFTKVETTDLGGLALKSDGTVVGWGSDYGQLDIPAGLSGVKDIASGYWFGLALKDDGTVTAWGNDYFGGISSLSSLTGIKAISARSYVLMAIKADKTVAVFGMRDYDQLNVPGDLTDVKAVATGYENCLALKEDGTVVAWGADYTGVNAVPAGLTDVKAISAGDSFAMALKNDGTVVAWGSDSRACGVPAGLSGITAISAGGTHAMALKANGTVVTWGSNDNGEAAPQHLTGAIGISAGYGYSLALINKPIEVTTTRSSFYSGSTTPVKGAAVFSAASASSRTVSLTSSDPAIVVPASVTVPAGQTQVSFNVVHYPVADAKTVTITGVSAEGTFALEVSLLPIAVASITFDHNNAEGGTDQSGILKLSAPPREAMTVTLSGDAPTTLFLNPTVQVAAANNVAFFSVVTLPVPKTTVVHVTAQAGGPAKTASLTLLGAPKIKSFKVSSPILYGNQEIVGTVTLSIPARAGGTAVTLNAAPGCTVPTTVTVPEGQTMVSFNIRGEDVASATTCNVLAASSYSSVGVSLAVRPNLVAGFELSSSAVQGGATTAGVVTLTASVAVDTLVDVSFSRRGVASAPSTVTVPAGSSTATFIISTQATATGAAINVSAGRLGAAKSKRLVVNP